MKNDSWEVVLRHEGKYVIGSKWVYNVKHATNSNIENHKAKFIAKVFSPVEGIDKKD